MDVRSLNPPYLPESDANAVPVRGDYAAGGRGGEENARRAKGEVLPTLLTVAEPPCSVRHDKLARLATMPMGRDALTSRATANSLISLGTAKRLFLRGAGSGTLPALIRNFAFLLNSNGGPL